MKNSSEKNMEYLHSAGIVIEKPNVHWEEIAGLEDAKQRLKERVILPLKFPHIFTGCRRLYRGGILLFGPRGSGKSSLVEAVATESDVTLFRVPCADLANQRIPAPEKLMENFFTVAKEHTPCILYFDEIHEVFGQLSSEDVTMRRLKFSFLMELEGLWRGDFVSYVLATTHKPWLLDSFVRRKFEVREYTPLPDSQARAQIFKLKLGSATHSLTDDDFMFLAENSEGFSGTDIAVVVRDALMQPARKLQTATHFRKVCDTTEDTNTAGQLTPCSSVYPGAIAVRFDQVPQDKLVLPDVDKTDVMMSLQTHKVSVTSEDLAKLQQFYDDFVGY